MKFEVKFSYASGAYDTCTIPYAFCDAAARILASIIGKKKYPSNKGIIIEECTPQQMTAEDMLNMFK